MENDRVYIHKVQMNPIDGWGKEIGMRIEVLGIYKDKQKAIDEKNKRDESQDATFCDVGKSWIEERDIE